MEESSKDCDCTNEQITELGPITPEDKPHGYGSYFIQFFKKNKKAATSDISKSEEKREENGVSQSNRRFSASPEEIFEQSTSSNSLKTLINDLNATPKEKLATLSGLEEVSLERTLPNVLTRIKNIIDKRRIPPLQYKDADFKHFWLPDHLSNKCYDCLDKFTPLRRRHHCRICGQVFCSKCCSRMIPGKIIGYKGELRVCTYCCKVVLTYLQSSNIEEDVLADLKVLQEELLPPKSSTKSLEMEPNMHCVAEMERQASALVRRKAVYGFMEENYTAKGRCFAPDFADQKQLEQMSAERQLLLKDSQQLHSLWSKMVMGPASLPLSTNRHRLKAFPDSFIGRDFVQWLLDSDKASSRQSAIAIGQAMLEAGFIFCVSQTQQVFVDEHVLYTTLKPTELKTQSPTAHSLSVSQETGREPLWLKQIPSQVEDDQDDGSLMKYNCTNKQLDYLVDLSASSSTYSLNLNYKESIVSLRNPFQECIGVTSTNRIKNLPFGYDVDDSLPTSSISAVLNDSILSSDSEQHSTGTIMAEEVLEALKTLEPKVAEATAAGWQQVNQLEEIAEWESKMDEQTKISLLMQKQFDGLWNGHRNSLLTQLLRSSKLDLSWTSTIIPLIYKIVDMVRPDVRNDLDDMDIRQYVQFKKVPGDSRNECRIINGTVCTKNVVHRQMKTRLTDPQILIISSFIDYHRSFRDKQDVSMDIALIQELEYTKNIVTKILSFKPDIVITGQGISYLVREYLMAEGLTLILNVKASVLERIARCTQAQILPAIDPDLPLLCDGPHRVLGMCHSFYLRPFMLPYPTTPRSNSSTPISLAPIPKTLMFFDGCATHLGCTVILRGAPNSELKRVKRVMYFMIFALFNWRLERSLFMDEFASVPGCLGDAGANSVVGVGNANTKIGTSDISSQRRLQLKVEDDAEEKHILAGEADVVADNSDPLCSFVRRDSEAEDPLIGPKSRETENELTEMTHNCQSFEAALEGTILSVSPHIQYAIPYLETTEGNKSPLRKFFPQTLYFSSLLRGCSDSSLSCQANELVPVKTSNERHGLCHAVKLKSSHSFVTSKITKGANDLSLRSALADFRARGGTIVRICHCQKNADKQNCAGEDIGDDIKYEKKENYHNFILTPEGKIDALHPYNHQRIAILFFSFSNTFHYTSVFCVNPRVLTMDFYGRNDIPLGAFLERYCFSPSYRCLSDVCRTPSLHHVRKFVHENGCIEILLRKMDSSFDDLNPVTIYMWTWCKECREVSPVVPMSADTWLFSFAKYLELRFRETAMTRRGTPGCNHSIHQDRIHYFGQKDLVAVIKYLTIPTRDLVIPPVEIDYTPCVLCHAEVVDMIKNIAIQGYNVFSTIMDRLSTIFDETGQRSVPFLKDVVSHHHQQKQAFRDHVEKIQLKLTSPSMEDYWRDAASSQWEMAAVMFEIFDQVILAKKLISQVVSDWNSKVQDLISLRKKDDKERLRSNSGNLLKQSSGSQFSVATALTGSVERMSVSSKTSDDVWLSVPSLPKEPSVDLSCETAPLEQDASKTCSGDQRKLLSSLSSQGSASNPNCSSSMDAQTSSLVPASGVQHSPKNLHERSLSDDGEMSLAKETADKASEKKYSSSVINIISTLWSSSADLMVKSPFDANEHLSLLPEVKIPIVIYDDEPSSIIARALASQEYEIGLQNKRQKETSNIAESSTSSGSNWLGDSQAVGGSYSFPEAAASLDGDSGVSSKLSDEEKSLPKDPHIDLQWSDQHANYYCKILFVEQFRKLRQLMFPYGEEFFIRSLSRCVIWEARGGKSGSFFCKTTDDRFILKQLSRLENNSFLEFAPSYIKYVTKCKKENKPTALTRIVGVYRVGFKNSTTNKAMKLDLLVMENLFYQRCIGPKFDLKGSVRNRKVNTTGKEESEVVLLDENLLQMVCSSPFYLRPHGKAVLTRAIAADSAFLAQQLIMDYSLLVGVDETNNHLVVGIIDYIRTFTWDKKLETIFKGSVLGAGTGKLPTVISPELYRTRFCHAMENYFVVAPDRWSGLGLSFDS